MYALPAGTLLQEFRIDAVLGHGGFGITYKAFDTSLKARLRLRCKTAGPKTRRGFRLLLPTNRQFQDPDRMLHRLCNLST